MTSSMQREANPCHFHEPYETQLECTAKVRYALINSAIMF